MITVTIKINEASEEHVVSAISWAGSFTNENEVRVLREMLTRLSAMNEGADAATQAVVVKPVGRG